MIPGVDLVEFIKVIGIFGLTAMIFAESGLLIGFFLPGDTVIFTAGFLVHAHLLPINIHLLALLLFVAAVAGDSIGYTFGHRVGRKLFDRPNSRLFKQAHKKHGGKAIVFARFIPAVRTFAPIVAGASKMPYRTFVTYNLLGGFGWVATNIYLGYFLGAWFESMGLSIDKVLLPLVFVILLISIAPAIYQLSVNKPQRQALWNGTKKEFALLFRRK